MVCSFPLDLEAGISRSPTTTLDSKSAQFAWPEYVLTIEMRRSAVEMLCHKKPEGVASFQSTVAKSWQVTQQEKAVSLSC
jgi:hypothetical protein